MVTQRPVLLSCVDKVMILRAGRIEAIGLPSQVLRRPVMRAPAAAPEGAAPSAKTAAL